MTVFKGYMKIVKQNKVIIMIYIVIFFSISLLIQMGHKDTQTSDYQSESVNIGFVEAEKSSLSKGVKTYLESYHQITILKDDKEILQENLFYGNVKYIIRVPVDFEDACLHKNKKLPVIPVPGSYTSFYIDQQINRFLNQVKTYYAAGYPVQEAVEAVLDYTEKPEIVVKSFHENGGNTPAYLEYFRMMPYILISILCYVLGSVLSVFYKPDIRMRMQASAVTVSRQNLEAVLAAVLLGAGVWAVCITGGLLLYGKEMLSDSNLGYYMLNSMVMTAVALAMAYLVGILVSSRDALNGIVNILGLGMGFLCGVFVPMEMLGKGVRTAAQFLPVYWYERNNDLFGQFQTITGTVQTEIWQGIGIQLIFAAAILSVAMAAAKRRQRI